MTSIESSRSVPSGTYGMQNNGSRSDQEIDQILEWMDKRIDHYMGMGHKLERAVALADQEWMDNEEILQQAVVHAVAKRTRR
jgi:hypothetical protein